MLRSHAHAFSYLQPLPAPLSGPVTSKLFALANAVRTLDNKDLASKSDQIKNQSSHQTFSSNEAENLCTTIADPNFSFCISLLLLLKSQEGQRLEFSSVVRWSVHEVK
jgi:hypothetical protein